MQISRGWGAVGSLELSIWIIGEVSINLCFVEYRNIYRHVYMHGLVHIPMVPDHPLNRLGSSDTQ